MPKTSQNSTQIHREMSKNKQIYRIDTKDLFQSALKVYFFKCLTRHPKHIYTRYNFRGGVPQCAV
jgi:hypothetical protein